MEQVREAGKSKSVSLSRKLSETKPNANFILLYLEFNKSNKQSVCYWLIYLKNSTFLNLKIVVDTDSSDWCQPNETSPLFKFSKLIK